MSQICELGSKHCVPCEGGATPMDQDKARRLLTELPGWTLSADGKMISRRFEFKGFYRTMAFINAMAWIVNRENHHPDFSAGYGHCQVGFTTHAIGGLSENDFICAARISALIEPD